MRRLIIALVGVVLATTGVVAQVSVQVEIPKDDFLVYESLPVTVSIRNFSGRTVQLEDNGDKPWLNFFVTGEANSIVATTGSVGTGDPVLIPAGQTISRSIDLLPLFQLRSQGTFWVRANISSDGVTASSTPQRFSLINGRELWTQTVGMPAEPGAKEDYCVYSLVARRSQSEEDLYVSVKQEPADSIFTLIPLGIVLPTGPPKVMLDRQGHLHVLFQNGPRSYGYEQVDPSAKVINRAAFSDFMSRPELVTREGVVSVAGGEQTYPKPEHILTDDELHPPAPPAKPAPKKKWWWPFGSNKPQSDDQ